MADVLVIHRPQRVNRSPGPGPQPAGRNSPGNPVTSMVSINSTVPTVIVLNCPVKNRLIFENFSVISVLLLV